jgi:hypothetical protein
VTIVGASRKENQEEKKMRKEKEIGEGFIMLFSLYTQSSQLYKRTHVVARKIMRIHA